MRICIIFNPAARGEKAKKLHKALEKLGSGYGLKLTNAPGAARRLAAEAVGEGYSIVAAAGGDGTLNEVLNGIGDVPEGFDQVRLAVLPLGTINVFARELRFPTRIDKWWPLLENPNEISIDVGSAEFSTPTGTEKRLFLQLAGAGVDARSVELVSWPLKKKIGPGAYLVAGLQAISSPQPRIRVSNGTTELNGELVLIGNGRLYGGEFPIFHKSDLQDGILDAVVFEQVNWQKLPGIALDFLLGRYFKEGRAAYLQGAELTFQSDTRTALQLDGELVGELPARISVLPQRLRVIAPQSGGEPSAKSS